MIVHVEKGTNAGVRPPFKGRAFPWRCKCGDRPGYLARCPECGDRRPV